MAKQLVFSRLADELVVSEGRYIRFSGRRGIYLKMGILKDSGKELIYAFIFDGDQRWTEELSKEYLKKTTINWIEMTKESLDLPDRKIGEIKKAIV